MHFREKLKIRKASRKSVIKADELRSSRTSHPFSIVGIGASAGGLEALTELLKHLPPDTGHGFVVVQHLDPVHESILASLLGKATAMPVVEAKNNLRVTPNQVHVIPPGARMTISRGVLKLAQRRKEPGVSHLIDVFLQSLAADQGVRAIGVILSGSAFDGTLGLEEVKGEGGITFAQDEKSAKYDSMPRSAVMAGCVDFVLTPMRIAQELARLAEHDPAPLEMEKSSAPAIHDIHYKKVLHWVRGRTALDLTYYKPTTIKRRIARRMVLHKIPKLSSYVSFLRNHPEEIEALYQDVLINVTSFFRNPEVFDVLKKKIFPKLIKNRTANEAVRIWTTGCSTGQEAFSIAMTFLEFAGKASTQVALQIFATDLNDTLLDKARNGLYTSAQMENVSAERLRRFFVKEEGGYRICKFIREMCVFARHDVLSDPPFSRMDLVSCRNLLIYLEAPLQRKLMPVFNYALKPGGFLLLGSSESIGGLSELFAVEDKVSKIYSKKMTSSRRMLHVQYPPARPSQKPRTDGKPLLMNLGLANEMDAQKEADRLALAKYAPAGVLVNEDMDILQFRGATGRFLEPVPGKASYNLLKMVREGLMLPVRMAVQKVKKTNETVRVENLSFQFNGRSQRINLEISPLKNLKDRCFLVTFEAADSPATTKRNHSAQADLLRKLSKDLADSMRETARLRNDLAVAKEYLQSVTEQYEAANEELQAANEESQSGNEELQSINEELETTKEELESTNEELTTVNEEMNTRNAELQSLNTDLNNVLAGVQICIVILGNDLSIRRFTPMAEKILNLVPTDVGRPITNIKPNIDFPDLEKTLLHAIATGHAAEAEVRDNAGHWYFFRVFPYKIVDNRVEGALLALLDIDPLKRSQETIKLARDYAESTLETVREPLVVVDGELRIERVNRSFYNTFQTLPAETVGKNLYEISGGRWNFPKLRNALEKVLPNNEAFDDLEVAGEFGHLGHRTMLLNARPIGDGKPRRILLAIDDITVRKQLSEKIADSNARLRESVQELEAFSYSISHDLRGPLRAMVGYADYALTDGGVNPTGKDALEKIITAANRLDRLIQDVLAYSRVARADIKLSRIDLDRLISDAIQQYPGFRESLAKIEIQSPLLPVMGHEAYLTQCVANLLSNAIKFVSPGTTPKIKIRTESRDSQVRIWFEDNGIGIETRDLPRIFSMFERVHQSEEYGGTGIGLSIVRKAMERMGGTAGAESKPGLGSRFWIQLKGAAP